MGILCVFCVYDTIGNRCFEKTSFPKMAWDVLSRDVLSGSQLKVLSVKLGGVMCQNLDSK